MPDSLNIVRICRSPFEWRAMDRDGRARCRWQGFDLSEARDDIDTWCAERGLTVDWNGGDSFMGMTNYPVRGGTS